MNSFRLLESQLILHPAQLWCFAAVAITSLKQSFEIHLDCIIFKHVSKLFLTIIPSIVFTVKVTAKSAMQNTQHCDLAHSNPGFQVNNLIDNMFDQLANSNQLVKLCALTVQNINPIHLVVR
jgi:hypothetical protein